MAIDPSAILTGRAPGRAPIGVILGIVFASVCLIVILAFDAITGGASFVVGLSLAVLPVAVWLPLVLALDRLEPEPPNALIFAFLWGAGVAALFASILNTLGLSLLTETELTGEEEGWYIVATFGAPVVEELLKGAVLFGMLWWRRQELNGPTDGVIYAAMVGLGFAATENIQYFIDAVEVDQLGYVFVLRAIVSPLLHPLCTAMTGIGVAVAALAGPGKLRRRAPLYGLLGAIALHSLWNGSTKFGIGGLAFAYLVGFAVLIGLIVILARDRRRIVQLIGHYLPLYGPVGIVTHDDLRMLSTLPGRRAARSWARAAGGRPAERAMTDYQQAATELALLHQRAGAQRDLDPHGLEQQRQYLVWVMQQARAAFLAVQPRPPAPTWGTTGFGPPTRL
jgi:RsiW-degrading membrane proteinase PrsW (M82 family)